MGFGCCLWWFLFGALLGWLLSWLLNRNRWRRDAVMQHTTALHAAHGGHSGHSGHGAGGANGTVTRTRTVHEAALSTTVVPPPASNVAASAAAAAVAAGITKRLKTAEGYDNFEIIEGIGPKINGLLHGAGIHTFEQLARTEVGALSKILDAAGPNFRLANPETWAQQAGLCARGEWEALKRLQDELVAGVRMKPETPDQA